MEGLGWYSSRAGRRTEPPPGKGGGSWEGTGESVGALGWGRGGEESHGRSLEKVTCPPWAGGAYL